MDKQQDAEMLSRRVEELERKVEELSNRVTRKRSGFFSDFFTGFFVVLVGLFFVGILVSVISNYM